MTQSAQKQSREAKIQQVADRLSKSEAFRRNAELTANQWAGILDDLDDEKLDGFTLILDEEDSGVKDIEQERLRKHASNKARYLHRLEKLKFSSEQIDDNLTK